MDVIAGMKAIYGDQLPDLSTMELHESELFNPEDSKTGSVMAGPAVLPPKVSEIEVFVHASQMHKVMTGNFGISADQQKKIDELVQRRDHPKPLTVDESATYSDLQAKGYDTLGKRDQNKYNKFKNQLAAPWGLTPTMKEDLAKLVHKKNNPDIGQTGKSYIDEMVTASLYGFQKEIYSWKLHHGNVNEPHSITMINNFLGTRFEKYEGERLEDKELLLRGTPDVYVPGTLIIDIKNPVDTFTFDEQRNFEMTLDGKTGVYKVSDKVDKIQKMYYYQGQAYMHLYDVPVFYLCYTLNEHPYMEEGNEYEQFGFLDRIIVKKLERDTSVIEKYSERLPAIKNAIEDSKSRRLNSMIRTGELLDEILGLVG